MRMIKGFILALAGLSLMITLLSLFIPSKVMVSRGVVVNATGTKVFAEIANLNNWKHWQPVFIADSGKMNIAGNGTGVNSFCEWESNGKKNKLIITALSADQVTISQLRIGENDVMNIISILPLPDTSRVQVEWKAITKLKWYPWEKFYGIFIEKFTGTGYEAALNSLKNRVENH